MPLRLPARSTHPDHVNHASLLLPRCIPAPNPPLPQTPALPPPPLCRLPSFSVLSPLSPAALPTPLPLQSPLRRRCDMPSQQRRRPGGAARATREVEEWPGCCTIAGHTAAEIAARSAHVVGQQVGVCCFPAPSPSPSEAPYEPCLRVHPRCRHGLLPLLALCPHGAMASSPAFRAPHGASRHHVLLL